MKKLQEVRVNGATVVFFSKGKRVAFCDESAVMYWVDFEKEKVFSKMIFSEGQMVWVYVANQHVVSVAYNNGENVNDLPTMEPVAL